MGIVGNEFPDLCVGLVNVFRIAGQGCPAKRSYAATEQRPYVSRYEAGKVECILHACVERNLSNVVAIVEGGDAKLLEREHRLDMDGHRLHGGGRDSAGIADALFEPLGDTPSGGQIAVGRVVRRRLVRHGVRPDTELHHLRQDLCGVAEQAHRHGFFTASRLVDDLHRVGQGLSACIEITGAQAHVDAVGLAFDRQHRGAGHRRRQWLRTAHAAETGGQYPAAAEIAAVMLASHFDKGFVGALHDALAADVDPRSGRHLAVHHETFFIELAEVIPVRPCGYKIRIRD